MSHDWISAEGSQGLVSIVVPTHNRAKLLVQTLASLLGQSYRPIQIVVVDDGSDDDTQSVVQRLIKEHVSHDTDLRYHHQSKGSAPAARNAGAKLTNGEYLVFMDDDDLARRDFLQSRLDALNTNPRANLAFGFWRSFDVHGNEYRILADRGDVPPGLAFDWYSFFDLRWQLLLQGCLLRRELVAAIGPWKVGLQKSQDMEYKARLLAHPTCTAVFAGPDVPVYYRIHNESISGVVNEQKLESHVEVIGQLEQMTMARDDYEQNKHRTADCLWAHSFWLYSIGDFERGYHQLRRAKFHDGSICHRKGALPRLFDTVGLDRLIGPSYFAVSRIKRALGLSKGTVISTHQTLPEVAVPSES